MALVNMEEIMEEKIEHQMKPWISRSDDQPEPSYLTFLPDEQHHLMSQAAEFGIMYPEEVDLMADTIPGMETSMRKDYAKQRPINAASKKQLLPVKVPFAGQAKLADELHRIIYANEVLLSNIKKHTFLVELKAFSLKEDYNQSISDHLERRQQLCDEIRELVVGQNVTAMFTSLKLHQSEYNLAKANLNSAISNGIPSSSPNGPDSLRIIVNLKTRALFATVNDLQAALKEVGDSTKHMEAGKKHCKSKIRNEDEKSVLELEVIGSKILKYEVKLTRPKSRKGYYEKVILELNQKLDFANLLSVLEEPINFLKFPQEIRDHIYGYALYSPRATRRAFQGHVLSKVSPQVRQEAGKWFYERNVFTCLNLFQIHPALENHLLPSLSEFLRNVHLTWASLGESTESAVKALESLPGLKTLHIYINWDQVRDYNCDTRAGVDSFKRLLSLPNFAPRVDNKGGDIKVFEFDLTVAERNYSDRVAMMGSLLSKGIMISRQKSINGSFTERLLTEDTPVRHLMTKAELDQKLDLVMSRVEVKEDREAAVSARLPAPRRGRAH